MHYFVMVRPPSLACASFSSTGSLPATTQMHKHRRCTGNKQKRGNFTAPPRSWSQSTQNDAGRPCCTTIAASCDKCVTAQMQQQCIVQDACCYDTVYRMYDPCSGCSVTPQNTVLFDGCRLCSMQQVYTLCHAVALRSARLQYHAER